MFLGRGCCIGESGLVYWERFLPARKLSQMFGEDDHFKIAKNVQKQQLSHLALTLITAISAPANPFWAVAGQVRTCRSNCHTRYYGGKHLGLSGPRVREKGEVRGGFLNFANTRIF